MWIYLADMLIDLKIFVLLLPRQVHRQQELRGLSSNFKKGLARPVPQI